MATPKNKFKRPAQKATPPVVDAPVVDAPAVDAPVVDAPVVDVAATPVMDVAVAPVAAFPIADAAPVAPMADVHVAATLAVDGRVDAPDAAVTPTPVADQDLGASTAGEPTAESKRLESDTLKIDAYAKAMAHNNSNTPDSITLNQRKLLGVFRHIIESSHTERLFKKRWTLLTKYFEDFNNSNSPFALRLVSRWGDLGQPKDRILLAKLVTIMQSHCMSGKASVSKTVDIGGMFSGDLSETGLALLSNYYS